MSELLGQTAAGGVIVMFVMSFIKDIGSTWPSQLKRTISLLLAGAASAVAVGANVDYGWTTFQSMDGWLLYIGAWQIAYVTMQANYIGWFESTRLNAGLAATGAKSGHEIIEYEG